MKTKFNKYLLGTHTM